MMIFDGRKLADEILNSLKEKISNWSSRPRLAVVSLGLEGQSAFIKQKEKAAVFLGCGFKHFNYPADVSAAELRAHLNKIVKSRLNTAVIVQMPIPSRINSSILNVIPPEKDPDLLSDRSLGMFFNDRALVEPPTAAAVFRILDKAGVDLAGKNVAVFGWGRLVGRFLPPMFLKRASAVSIVDEHTSFEAILEFSRKADIIVSATGKPKLITAEMVKDGCVVVDAGFSMVDGKIAGDADFETVKQKAALITPVPGGVGPVGVAMLFENVVKLFEKFHFPTNYE
ncbi:MAG: bifunctional 5,10-methylenetetrahydrofolate dehydrogenase/5,10-methenyltetrahydrofolate cyclohydrolase [Parcubacteria group bacterium]|nr:bifunctional 5,10-methylenetetrahydrofolate dehydrogenase/5,10-methenyltetrahydrofolate cyclohydrolase [Parcubacteria group bacterium]